MQTFAEREWDNFVESLADKVRSRLEESLSELSPEDRPRLVKAMNFLHLRGTIQKSNAAAVVADAASSDAEQQSLLYAYLRRIEELADTRLSEEVLNDELGSFIFLLHILGCTVSKGLVLKRHPDIKQSFPNTSQFELDRLQQAEEALRSLLERIFKGEEKPLTMPEAIGALALSLIAETGVLGLGELRGAVEYALTERVRCARGLRYFWLKLGESRGIVQEHRRVFLTPLSAALAMGLKTDAKVADVDIKVALVEIGRRLGFHSKNKVRVTQTMRAASARLRMQPNIPQFVVDYAEQLFVSHSVKEETWRRICELEPWPDEGIDDDAVSRAAEPEPPADESFVAQPALKAGALGEAGKILNTAESTAQSLVMLRDRLSGWKPEAERLPIFGALLDWLIDLHTQPSSNGQVRRIRSIRNLFNALAPRAIAAYRDRSLESIDSDEWLHVIEHIADDPISESWRNTIRYAVFHFLRFLTIRGTLAASPFSESIGRAGSAVAANVLTRKELERCMRLIAPMGGKGVSMQDRVSVFLMEMCFSLGLRRSEALWLLAEEVLPGSQVAVDIVNNAERTLKTDSSSRRLLLRRKHAKLAKKLIGFRNEVKNGALVLRRILKSESDSVTRRANEAVQAGTNDASAHLHIGRHSYATWTLTELCGSDLQLHRFVGDMPFLSEVLAESDDIRLDLRQGQCTLHDLHEVRGTLGHRHEEMSLLHYIHCLDYLRYAAVTVNRAALPASALCAAAGLTRFSASSRKVGSEMVDWSEEDALRHIESVRAERCMRHDAPLELSIHQTLGVEIQKATTYRAWMNTDDAAGSAEAGASASLPSLVSAGSVEREKKVVELINSAKALGARKSIQSLADIKPKSKAQERMALGVSQAIEADDLRNLDNRMMAGVAISSVHQRGSGLFVFQTYSNAKPVAEWLEKIGRFAQFDVELSQEITRTNAQTRKRERRYVALSGNHNELSSVVGRIFLKPVWKAEGKRKALPHSAFIWALGCLLSKESST